jgi:hypothetical protein
MFFSNLKLKIRKRTFINVLFSKIQNTFEKTLHHSLFKRPPSAVCDLVALHNALVFIYLDGHVQTIMRWLRRSPESSHKGSDGRGGCLAEFLVGRFWGCF